MFYAGANRKENRGGEHATVHGPRPASVGGAVGEDGEFWWGMAGGRTETGDSDLSLESWVMVVRVLLEAVEGAVGVAGWAHRRYAVGLVWVMVIGC
jgi:hypothetical protein